MTHLDQLVRQQKLITDLLKSAENIKKKIREQLFTVANDEQPDHLLPVTTIKVPHYFFDGTLMAYSDFITSRFPSYNVVEYNSDDEGVVFILKKKPEYMPWSYSVDNIEVARSVSENTPDIDWESMRLTEPDLFEKFAEPVQTYKLRADVFQDYMKENPSFDAQTFLARHTIHKAPTLRVLTKVKKDDE